uniref:Matrilin 4 n=1 Tax=Fundulus heteroclitus TaxID=8078 RepID=A0A3Q2TVC6_FUNHE
QLWSPDQKCKSGPVDLVFLIDSSRSVRPHEFETMRKFMIDILNTLDIGLDTTRVGVVQYSSKVRSEFFLKTHSKLESMVKAINEIVPLAQGTMTGLAIRYLMNEAFTPGQGDRPKVPNVAVIVTDGRPQDRVAEVAAEAREKGIEIYAVGVARADMTSLRAMASPPFEDHVFLVERFDLIHQFGLQFQDKLCGIDLCLESDHGCEHICESSPGSYTCDCLPGYRLNTDGKTCSACKSANIDLVLLIDGSKSVRPQNFELVKKFVNQVVDSLDVSAHGTRVGLVQYSSRVRTEFPLNMYHTAADIKNAVMKVDYMEKGTMTGLALKHMLENSFSEAEGARPASRNIPRVGLVFTDGRSQDDISEYAKKAKEAGQCQDSGFVSGLFIHSPLCSVTSQPPLSTLIRSTDYPQSQGEVEVKDPCACENMVEFQQGTINTLDLLTEKHILLMKIQNIFSIQVTLFIYDHIFMI